MKIFSEIIERPCFNEIYESWWNFVERFPYLYGNPFCGSCAHWFLIDDDGLDYLFSNSYRAEYNEIVTGLSGKGTYSETNGFAVSTHRFYGWCKRYPPSQRNHYSEVEFRSLSKWWKRYFPKIIAEYSFPLMPHDCSCGEWKEDCNVADFYSEKLKSES